MLIPTDDGELARRALGGDREAFRALVERHYDLIYRIALRYLGSSADAEDIAQEVCLGLATKLAQFGHRSRFSTWVASIVINACRDALRRRKSSERLLERYVALRADEEADLADAERRSAWLHAALQTLEPTLRETVLLVIGEDLAHAEAAAALGCAESTVSWRLHQARKRLRSQLDTYDDG